MKLGIKVGLKGNSKLDLALTNPDFCEIWFHSGKIEAYNELITYVMRQGCDVGLHFWGQLNDGTQANLCYPNSMVLKKSRDLVKKTIDYAALHRCIYVNVHPGEFALLKLDFDQEIAIRTTAKKTIAECETVLTESLTELAKYAQNFSVPLYVESLPVLYPGTPWHGLEGRKHPVDIPQVSVSLTEKMLGIPNLFFTNDFGHTAGNVISERREDVKQFLFEKTRILQNQTKLLHVGYLIPPYNGTDYHGCLYYKDFKTNLAIPNFDEMKQLLELFLHRADVGALAEPEKDHVGNFEFLKRLVIDTQKRP